MATSWQMAAKALRPLPVLHKDLSEESRVRQRYVDLDRAAGGARHGAHARRRGPLAARVVPPARLPRGRDADAAGAARRRDGTAVRDALQRASTSTSTCASHRSCSSSGASSAVSTGCSRSTATSATRAPTRRTRRSSPWSRPTRRTATTTRIGTLTRELVQEAATAVHGSTVVTLADGTEYDVGGDWAQITLYGSLSEALGEEIGPDTPRDELRDARREARRPGARSTTARKARPRNSSRSSSCPTLLRADVRARLPGGDGAADPRAPDDAGARGEVGPVRPLVRARDRILRTRRPGRAAGAVPGPGASGRGRRRRGHAAGRGLPACAWSTGCRRPAGWAWGSTAC